MTKSGLHQNAFGEHLDAFKNAGFVWDTRRTSHPHGDHQPDEEHEVEQFDEYRRKIPARHVGNEPPARADHHDTAFEDTEEICHVWTYFGKQTTVHGAKNIVSEDRRRYSRVLWLLLVLVMTAGLAYTVAILLIEYYQYNTVTKTDVKINEWAVFPSITMCNTCPFKNADSRKDTAIFKLAAGTSVILKDLFSVNFSDPDMIALLKTDIVELINTYAYKAEELFFSAKYENIDVNISDAFEAIETALGRCFTFNGPEYMAKYGARQATSDGRESGLRLYVRLNQDQYFIWKDLTAGLRIYIANPPDTPRLKKDGIDIHPGTSTRLALSPIKYSFLPAPYKSFGDDYCQEVETIDLRHKMVNATFYSYNNCLEQCLSFRASTKCGCYSHLLYVPNLRRCTVMDIVSCYTKTRENLTSDTCDCPRPCTFTMYDSTMSASQMPSRVSAEFLRRLANVSTTPELREDFLEIRVYLETMMLRHEKHEAQYNFSSIFAFLGGQMGFFLGASLVTIAELVEAAVFSLYVFINKKIMRMGQLNMHAQVKPGKR